MLNVHIVVEIPSVGNHRVVLHKCLCLLPASGARSYTGANSCFSGWAVFQSHASHRRRSDVHLSYVSGANSRRVRTAQVSFRKREWVLTILWHMEWCHFNSFPCSLFANEKWVLRGQTCANCDMQGLHRVLVGLPFNVLECALKV